MNLVDSFVVGGTTIEVALTDITDAQVDVIVNSICDNLHFGSGVSRAITRSGGYQIKQAAVKAAEFRQIKPGDVVITHAGNLPFKHVFHAISSGCTSGTTEKVLRRCTVTCLHEASSRKVSSIAFPALGTGEMQFDMKLAAAVLIDTVVDYCSSTPGLDRVVFCLLKPNAFTAFFRHAVRRSIALDETQPEGRDASEVAAALGNQEEATLDSIARRIREPFNGHERDDVVRQALSCLFAPSLVDTRECLTTDLPFGHTEMRFSVDARGGFWKQLQEEYATDRVITILVGDEETDPDAVASHMEALIRKSGSGCVGVIVGTRGSATKFTEASVGVLERSGHIVLCFDDTDLLQMIRLKRLGKPVDTSLQVKLNALLVSATDHGTPLKEADVPRPKRVFVSYAREDTSHRKRLEKSLSLLHIQGCLDVWSDGRILAGSSWKEEVVENLSQADIVVCLLSLDFIASGPCFLLELPLALQRREAEGAQLVPILIRPCEWDQTQIADMNVIPLDASGQLKPLSQWDDEDLAWLEISKQFRRLVDGCPS